AAMFDLSREMNRQRDEGHSITDAQECLRHLGSLLGLTFEEREAPLNVDVGSYNALVSGIRDQVTGTDQKELVDLISSADAAGVETVSAENIDLLISLRAECRNYKQYALADEIRGWLDSQGVSVEDSAAGSVWSYRPVS
nr:cysteine--tRNA ligase [Chloroflexota bacterium]